MNIGIVGQGYVGKAVRDVFQKHYHIETFDIDKSLSSTCGGVSWDSLLGNFIILYFLLYK